MPPRLFTLAEAEEMLPRVVPLLERIRDSRREAAEREAEAQGLLEHVAGNGHKVDAKRVQEARQAAARASAALRRAAAELDQLGVELKDPDTGLIDFRSRRQGRVVYLCWRLGEPRIDYWHELDTGFAGRRPLERD